MKTLIDVDELHATLGADDLFVFDCRASLTDKEEGRRLFNEMHIPGAQYAHLDQDLSGSIIAGKTGRHPLPRQEDFLSTVRRWGVTQNAAVVAYDDASGAFAARLWWMFRWLGHDDVAVLDGGLAAWKQRGYPLTDEINEVQESAFEAREPLTRTVSAQDIPNSQVPLIDARSEDRFRGDVEPVDPVAGHIPGAICLPFSNNLNESNRFKDAAVLANRFRNAGISADQGTICYCGSGVSATHNILALVHSGFAEPALYPGSWSEWVTDPDRPVERT
ncbi:MAG: sulfurtransferase [Pseudomonadales bacterium]